MRVSSLAFCVTSLSMSLAFAQTALRVPQPSPAASTGQTIGITDVSITYHRPAVRKRKIWGGLVPHDAIWRAGANENTTVSFSTPVKVEGQPLSAGTYGLLMLPGVSRWTVIFSRFTGDWGAYRYDPREDALRVSVSPHSGATFQERLAYTFDDVSDRSATASLCWERLCIPIRIDVDLHETVRSAIHEELRGGKYWDSNAWTEAAQWEARNGDLEAALEDADRALATQVTFRALSTKAAILKKKGDSKGAAATLERAKSIANESETIDSTAQSMMAEKKLDEAIAFLRDYAETHPSSLEMWRVQALLGEAYSAKGDTGKADESFDRAKAAAHTTSDRAEVQDSINAARSEAK